MEYKNLIDTHCHIVAREYEDNKQIIENAKANGLSKMLIICCTLKEAYKALALKEKNNDLYEVAVGFHPEDTGKITEDDFKELELLLSREDVLALGEVGLDYYWVKDNALEQKELFKRQILLANKYNKPIIIHSRDAIKDTYDILKEMPVNKRGIIHCFSSSLEMANEFIKMGYYIALGGPVTFKNAHEPKKVATNINIDYLLIETDCPYLTPVPFRGKQNEPMYIKYIYEEIAKLRGIEVEDLIKIVNDNYDRLFNKN